MTIATTLRKIVAMSPAIPRIIPQSTVDGCISRILHKNTVIDLLPYLLIDSIHDQVQSQPFRRAPQALQARLRPGRKGHERGSPEADRGLRREGRKETEEITRKEA